MLVGIVGKPNVGKSAFYRSLTLAEAESGNFPFTTIKANSAVGYVKIKDPAVDFGKHSNPREGYVLGDSRFVPVDVIDVAGLVPGAHENKGLGNQFLDDLRPAHALIHVIDLSGATNEKGEPVDMNSYDPAEDIKFLEFELDQWFLGIIKRNWENIYKKIRMQDMKVETALANVLSGLNIMEDSILIALKDLNLDKTNIADNLGPLAKKLRELTKPMVIAANKCDVLQDDKLWEKKLNKLKEQFPNHKIIPIMAEYEWNLRKAHKAGLIEYISGESSFEIKDESKLNDAQKAGLGKIKKVVDEMGSTGVQECINTAVFDILKMIPLCPGGVSKLEDKNGNVLPDCFLMPEGTTALEFAYRLHTDFGKNFIQAVNCKTKMPMGKDAVLKAGDILEIKAGR
jgi:hypothetical protein